MADDSNSQIIGTVAAAACCVILWGTASLANVRLLNHLERRYYNNNTNSKRKGLDNPNASGIASTLVAPGSPEGGIRSNNIVQDLNGSNVGMMAGAYMNNNINITQNNNNLYGANSALRNRSGIEQFAASAGNSWTKDNRLLFYILAVLCSIWYGGFILMMLMTAHNPNSSLGDIVSTFSVATYLSMIVMVFWTVLEGVETVKRLGMSNWNNRNNNKNIGGISSPGNNNNNNNQISSGGKKGNAKSSNTRNSKKRSSAKIEKTRASVASNSKDVGGVMGQEEEGDSSTAFSMSHPTGSELHGDDEDDDVSNPRLNSRGVLIDNNDDDSDDEIAYDERPYGGDEDDEDDDAFAGGDGFGKGKQNHSSNISHNNVNNHHLNSNNNNNQNVMNTIGGSATSMSTRDNTIKSNSNTTSSQQYVPSNSGLSGTQNDSFKDDGYGTIVNNNNNKKHVTAPEGDDDDGFGSVGGRNAAYYSNNKNGTESTARITSANLPVVNLHNNNGGNASRFSNGGVSNHELASQSSKMSNVRYYNPDQQGEDDKNRRESLFFDGCDLWEQRGFWSLVAIFCTYFIFVVIDQALEDTHHHDQSVIQWGSCIVSFFIGMLCIFQAFNTYKSFRNTSESLAFLFVSIFGILSFFLILRACLVFPYIQRSIPSGLVLAFISNGDAISMLILLLRVPKSK